MKKVILGCLAAMFVTACQDNDTGKKEFTGNEATYALSPGSAYPIDGTVTFREKTDGSTLVVLQLNGTEGNLQHPAHLHAGDISTPDADIAALLNPVTGSTGRSETLLRELSDESPVNYAQLLVLDACIKVHLAAAGPEKDIILAGGNIGKDIGASGRLKFGVCKSE